MALPIDFPSSPYEVLDPDNRWFPDAKTVEKNFNLIPPLVDKIRRDVKEWRDNDYEGASETTKSLLHFWFEEEHFIENVNNDPFEFKYYFAQRESVETIIYLHEIANVEDKHDLLKYDSSGIIKAEDFPESWARFVVKMATGSGKTKVLSLILVWSFFHKTYENNSDLSRNFLVITPNIIVLDRIRSDFEGLKTFFLDPMVPEDGYHSRNWKTDFQLDVHIQDNVNQINKTGNIFLTNIHRVYDSKYTEPSFEDEDTTGYFLGKKAKDVKEDHVDLGDIVRDIDELMILNDEAHHIHDSKLQWFKSIEDIHYNLKQKGNKLSMQVDFTATPKDTKGFIFPQTVSDYPLVEAIHQNIVKQPFIPDDESRENMKEVESVKVEERYAEYLHVGYHEWKKAYDEHIGLGKKAVLFIMVEDTKKCDAVAEYLERTYPEFEDSVLTIHTNAKGDLKDGTSKKAKEELEILRKAANEIDSLDSPYKVIVSVLVLKEGWDVKNVTTIVGLRSFTSKSKILPEQTLGRGLRKMYRNTEERLMIIGTEAFMEFIESIKSEGVKLGKTHIGPTGPAHAMRIEVDLDNENKDIDELDILIPVLEPSFYKDYIKLKQMDVSKFNVNKFEIINFGEDKLKEINFVHIIDDDKRETLTLKDGNTINYRSMLKYYAGVILKETKLVSGNATVYGKLKDFISNYLFEEPVDLEDPNIIKNVSRREVSKTILDTFIYYVNNITTSIVSEPKIMTWNSVADTNPFIVKEQGYVVPQKSVFNKIIGDSGFELSFAEKLEWCSDIVSYTKNYLAVQYHIQYQDRNGKISKYYPDFLVKTSDTKIYVIETKGNADLDVPLKLARLKEWCSDVNSQQNQITYIPLYVEQEKYEKQPINSFNELIRLFEHELDFMINKD
jgi:type III restriction enzyme